MKAAFLAAIFFMMFQSNANATTTLWQAVGVTQYEESNQTMVADVFDVGNLLSLAACNAVIADHNQLLQAGSVTPSGGEASQQKNTKSAVDAICHAVITPQLPGYYYIGQMEIKQHNVKSQPKQVKIGPFANLSLCNSGGATQKNLTLQKTPLTKFNVYYQLKGGCRKLID